MTQLGGCYYLQAASGQIDLMSRREPIEAVIADEATPAPLRARLELVSEAREYAVRELHLPDNDSYRSFAALDRDYVVWNLFAAPEFSVEPITWCYPVVGCVAYRGYFDVEDARRYAAKLEAKGRDVHLGGVAAYSTLGRFADPVLSTMMRWADADLVAVLFHELAHQQLFVKGDTAFNESFATAVAEAGLERWLTARGAVDELEAYRARVALREALAELAADTRTALAGIYASGRDEAGMRAAKQRILAGLATSAQDEARRRGLAELNFLRPPLNNATLVPIGLYRGYVDGFRALLDACDSDMPCLYARAEELAELPPEARASRLDALAAAVGDQRPAAGTSAGAGATAAAR